MSDSHFKYGVGYTSVKMHQAPGGNSSINLGWDEPNRPPPVQKWTNPQPTQQISNVFNNGPGPSQFQPGFPNQRPPQPNIYAPRDQLHQNPRVELFNQPEQPKFQQEIAVKHFQREAPPNYYQRQQMTENNQRLQDYSQLTGPNQIFRQPEPMQNQFQSNMQREPMQNMFQGNNQREPTQNMFQQNFQPQFEAPPQQNFAPRQNTRERPPDPYGRNPNYDMYGNEVYQSPPPQPRQEENRGLFIQDAGMKPSTRVSNPPGGRSNFTFG